MSGGSRKNGKPLYQHNFMKREYCLANREEILRKKKEYKISHKEQYIQWAIKNKERIARLAHNRYMENREKELAYRKNYFQKKKLELLNGDPAILLASREIYKARERIRRKNLRSEYINAYGSKCSCCGETELRFLTLEHIKKDGGLHRKIVGGNYPIYVDLKRRGWPQGDYTLLCWNCNCAERYGEKCPHKLKKEKECAFQL